MKYGIVKSISALYHRGIRKLKKEGFTAISKHLHRLVISFFSGFHLKKPDDSSCNILFVIGCFEGESKRYRVYNIIEAISLYGINGQAVYQESLPYLSPTGYSAIVFFRCKMNSFTRGFVTKCKRRSVPTIYDVDDLVFDEAIVDKNRAEEGMTAKQYQVYLNEVKNYVSMLKVCDYATSPTTFLCDYMHNLSEKPVYRIPNGLNNAQIDIAAEISNKQSSDLRIGFLSGSPTHNRDFSQVEDALVSIMTKHENVSLVVVGYLSIPESLAPFINRIIIQPFLDYQRFLRFCNQLYLVIVPLEYDTAFCNAKSELKYFEQALIGLPVIASPTDTYRECITHGENGLLAATKEEWEHALDLLIRDRAMRDTIAKNAQSQIRGAYYPDIIGKIASDFYMKVIS